LRFPILLWKMPFITGKIVNEEFFRRLWAICSKNRSQQSFFPESSLQWGLIFSGLGAVLILVLIPFAWGNFWLLLLFGLLPLALGLGLMLIYLFTQEGSQADEESAEEKNEI